MELELNRGGSGFGLEVFLLIGKWYGASIADTHCIQRAFGHKIDILVGWVPPRENLYSSTQMDGAFKPTICMT